MRAYAVSLLVCLVAACSGDERSPGNPFGGSGGGGGADAAVEGGAGAEPDGSAGDGGTAGEPGDAGPDQVASDAAGSGGSPDGSAGSAQEGGAGSAGDADLDAAFLPDALFLPDAVVLDAPYDTCPSGQLAVGTLGLQAGLDTPSAFASAYNAEVAAMGGAGPLLLVLHGLDSPHKPNWRALFGPPAAISGGGYQVTEYPTWVPLVLAHGNAASIVYEETEILLRFQTATTQLDLWAVAVEMHSQVAADCHSLSIASLRLLIPVDDEPDAMFHGSALADLMGPPTATWGGTNDAWVLELTGDADRVAYQAP